MFTLQMKHCCLGAVTKPSIQKVAERRLDWGKCLIGRKSV